jgi:hypothetical protein
MERKSSGNFILGLFIFLGLAALGYLLGESAIRFKEYERTVRVKGLSEKEYPADVVLWPIQFTEANNDLTAIYSSLDKSNQKILGFLEKSGIDSQEITISPPAVTDKLAQQYSNSTRAKFRYTAVQTITVYSKKVEDVRKIITKLAELGKQGIVFKSGDYRNTTEFIFTRLNSVKPEMVEEATTKAREVAEKFAKDSNSTLGKIKRATQGQFTISPRDRNNPHIKKIRVVTTVEYYLSD